MNKFWSLMHLAMIGAAACTSGGPQPGAASAPLGATAEAAPAAAALSTAGSLTLIPDANQVCMVNNQFMGRDQIPMQFEDRTYYGCCAGCVTRIQSDPSVRVATDPVTGHQVDKATAVMAQDSEGNVQYFESQGSFAQFGSRT